MQTENIVDENVAFIEQRFPNCVIEAKDEQGKITKMVDFDLLKQELSKVVVDGDKERYQMTWPDKKQAILTANSPIAKTLRPCKEKSVDFDNTKNIYIEGDNLDVLKLLRETYLGKVKMIFIDPPYNTGSDFVYSDDFAIDTDKYLQKSNQVDEEGNRMVVNSDSNGRFHTDWLNMMYSRLKTAKDLLTDDGAIFVSIDYNEFANLKKIMDEIFGEENFQREIIWRIGWLSGYKTTAPNFIRNHDTILFYSKNVYNMGFNKKYIENRDFKPLVKKEPKLTSKLAELGLSDAQQNELLRFINHDNRPDKYPIEDTWNCNEYDDLNSIAIVSFSGEKISKILQIDQDFKGQKSVKMLRRLIEATTNDNDIIMDFFSGTGSTAHAVMQMNKELGTKRKFIMVQLPEETETNSVAYKEGYRTICDIGEARLKAVGNRLVEEQAQLNNAFKQTGFEPMKAHAEFTTSEKALAEQENVRKWLDVGFRVFKLDSSNMKDTYYKPSEYNLNLLDALDENIKPDRTPEDLLFQVMLDLGLMLDSKIEEKNINGKKVFIVGEYNEMVKPDLICCFDSNVDNNTVTEIAKMQPRFAVFRDSSMAKDSVAVNFDQIFETYSPSTTRKVL